MITGEIKNVEQSTEVIFPMEIEVTIQEESTIETKEKQLPITEQVSKIISNEERFFRFKKSLRKRSISIL